MLSLVAYDASDSEDSQSQNDSDDTENEINIVTSNVGSVQIVTKTTKEPDKSNIFNALPQPQTIQVEKVEEEDDEFLRKKEMPIEKPKKQAIKITVPSLAQFDSDEDDEAPKKPRATEKSCGLFQLLPPPKTAPITTKHFVPNSVKRKMNQNKKPTTKKLSTSTHNKKETPDVQESDDEDDDLKTIPDTYDDEMWQKVCGKKERRIPKPIISETTTEFLPIIQPDPEVSKPYEGLDNQAFKELIGGSNKRKAEVIDLIEIKEDEILSDKNIWMTKSLTDPEMAPKYVVKDPVNDTCKRKHHITYLAQQAKANEQELQNQWASSRFTRQKTQAKYGF